MEPALGPRGIGPLDTGGIIDRAVALYRTGFVPLTCAVAIVTVPTQIVSSIVGSVGSDDFGVTESRDALGRTQVDVDLGDLGVGLLALGVGLVITFIGAQLATAACTRLVASDFLGTPTTWRDSLRFARARFWPMLGLTLLTVALLVPAFVALVVPGVYLVIAWIVATPALLLEELRPWDALKRSRELVRGRWWPTFGVVLLAGVLSAVVGGVLTAALTVPFDLVDASSVVRTIAGTVAAIVSATLITPFSAAVYVVVYVDLRVRHEGFDDQLHAHGIGGPPSPPAPEWADIPPPPIYEPPSA